MEDSLIINGKKYIHTPEVQEKRLSGWVNTGIIFNNLVHISEQHNYVYMEQKGDDEIIVSKQDVQNALDKTVIHGEISEDEFMKELGFKE